jgi:hypothetical protein
MPTLFGVVYVLCTVFWIAINRLIPQSYEVQVDLEPKYCGFAYSCRDGRIGRRQGFRSGPQAEHTPHTNTQLNIYLCIIMVGNTNDRLKAGSIT